jgi:hypothetical protein
VLTGGVETAGQRTNMRCVHTRSNLAVNRLCIWLSVSGSLRAQPTRQNCVTEQTINVVDEGLPVVVKQEEPREMIASGAGQATFAGIACMDATVGPCTSMLTPEARSGGGSASGRGPGYVGILLFAIRASEITRDLT